MTNYDEEDVGDPKPPFWSQMEWNPKKWERNPKKWNWKAIRKQGKAFIIASGMVVVWLYFTILLMMNDATHLSFHIIPLEENTPKNFHIKEKLVNNNLSLTFKGHFMGEYERTDNNTRWLKVFFQLIEENQAGTNGTTDKNITKIFEWKVGLLPVQRIEGIPYRKVAVHVTSGNIDLSSLSSDTVVNVMMVSTMEGGTSVNFMYNLTPLDESTSIIHAAIVLIGLYVFIIFELIHRTLAAMFASTMALAVLATYSERPTTDEIVSWIDSETLLLLAAMMMVVAITTKTGIFDYISVLAYKLTRGRVWYLITTLCLFCCLLSSIIDNVTTVLLMTPVTIRLCEVLHLNPVPVLLIMIMFANICGALTPVSDPPNAIIANNQDVIDSGIGFGTFVLHMLIGTTLISIVAFLHLRFITFRNPKSLRFAESIEVEELKHKMAVLKKTASILRPVTEDESAMKLALQNRVRRLAHSISVKRDSVTSIISVTPAVHQSKDNFETILAQMQKKYPIRDRILLIKSGVALTFAVIMFFMNSVPNMYLSLGWIALLAALMLLLLADREEMDGVLARVEWSTLLFFAALFILMEAMTELGLISWIGRKTEGIILSVDRDNQLTVALLLILWVTAFASALIDNIPLTTMMLRIVIRLSKHEDLDLPLQPLIWALAYGGALGGNGTLIASSANVVCTGVADQHGYKVTFVKFFQVGFPVMIVTVIVASVYLLISHVALTWHPPKK